MGVEIKILGPWEVTADGAVLKLAGARRVGVLARLALNVGQVVTTERIVADVWADSSASTAGKQLHIVDLPRSGPARRGMDVVAPIAQHPSRRRAADPGRGRSLPESGCA
ncbi:hypothetical protein [Nonomuraea sp. NPDC049480]|uniref:hypothetical protein n=1 Tax=Nonomuraea sp. NPDC049480 TaxID=3364353 RepID=UPI003797501B